MLPYAIFNKGFRYILVVINTFSKIVFVQPVRQKTAKNVARATRTILEEAKTLPMQIQSDLGKEFYNKDFKQLMANYNINQYSIFSNVKASIVERVNQTLKKLMWKQFNSQGTYKRLNILNYIVFKYNNTEHRTTGLKPTDINEKNENKS